MQRWGKGGQRPTGAGEPAGDRRRLAESRDGGDRRFAALLYVAGALIPGLLGLVLWTCLRQAWPALARLGVSTAQEALDLVQDQAQKELDDWRTKSKS